MDKSAPEKPHIGSHLQADAVSITSSVSHASASHVSNEFTPFYYSCILFEQFQT